MENYILEDTFSGCFKFFMVLLKLEDIVDWEDRHKIAHYWLTNEKL